VTPRVASHSPDEDSTLLPPTTHAHGSPTPDHITITSHSQTTSSSQVIITRPRHHHKSSPDHAIITSHHQTTPSSHVITRPHHHHKSSSPDHAIITSHHQTTTPSAAVGQDSKQHVTDKTEYEETETELVHRKWRSNVNLGQLDWIVQCFTSPPTQYRLYGRRFLQVKKVVSMTSHTRPIRPNQQYQSTGAVLLAKMLTYFCNAFDSHHLALVWPRLTSVWHTFLIQRKRWEVLSTAVFIYPSAKMEVSWQIFVFCEFFLFLVMIDGHLCYR